MKVILMADVKNLGKKGDLVQVADGYARNYLLPRGLALVATEDKVKQLARQRDGAARRKMKEEERSRELAARLDGLTVRVYGKAGERGRLFGSVNNKDIAEALQKEHGIEVDKRKIILKEPIKQLGTYPVQVRLYPQVEARLTVQVLAG
ncbi:MAG: 50S ribosomal protein L9 [Armatimonadetes bacterium]|nr:50S ribosomal protein L9 [Armatimonadota bacterium]